MRTYEIEAKIWLGVKAESEEDAREAYNVFTGYIHSEIENGPPDLQLDGAEADFAYFQDTKPENVKVEDVTEER